MNKTILIPVFLAIAVGLVLGLVSPKYKIYKDKLATVELKAAELQTVKAYYDYVDKTSEELAKYPLEMAKINLALPNEISEGAVSDYLNKKASEAGLISKQTAIPLIKAQSGLNPSLKENNAELSLSGSYSALKNFLSNIESSARMAEVGKISFLVSDEKDSLLSINLSLKFYSY
jgi:hypothetical protein